MAANSVFARLNYNFDDAKFGDALFLTPQAKKYLDLSIKRFEELDKNIKNVLEIKNMIMINCKRINWN